MSIETEVLEIIRPTREDSEHIDSVAKILRENVETYLKEHNIHAKTMFTGSYSKGTYLDDPDLDLFILFPMGTAREELVKTGLQIGEDVLHGQRMYAEHPYTTGRYMGVEVDLVPAMDIPGTDALQTAVDRTPFHTRYVLSHLKPGQGDEIRLLKKFMKGVKVYGAEPDIRGFPGYLCEILVLKYGTFLNVLKNAAEQWHAGTRIDLEGPGPAIDSALVFYDPVDPKRNVASAVHLETLSRFILASKEYLKCPSKRFFFYEKRPEMPKEDIRRIVEDRGSRIVSLSFDRPDVIKENIYSQLWKSKAGLEKKIDDNGLSRLNYAHFDDGKRIYLSFELENDTIPKVCKHIGPPVWVRMSAAFLEKWKDNVYGAPFVENGRWTVIAERPYRTAKQVLESTASQAGIGKEFDIGSLQVYDHEESLEKCPSELLRNLVSPRMPWETE
ncbi:MAG: CCA tRNA nucleotidyltransferase [archaeon]|nr:CCA tRNA nucleotidyltransferase [archaeon]